MLDSRKGQWANMYKEFSRKQCNQFPNLIHTLAFTWTGIRDDLTLLLDEEIHSVNLCALHCEMKNTEQILGSLGLYACKIGTLDSLNTMLAELGPKSMKENFIRIKSDRNKYLEVTKNHIKVASISGKYSN